MKHETDTKTQRAARDAARDSAPPLAWWRTMEAQAFDATAAAAMREAISTIAIIDAPTWRAAVAGDAAAAAGLALRLHPDRSTPLAFDLVMTAVAACAAESDATACLMMARVVPLRRGAGETEARIAASWLTRASASGSGRRRTGGKP